MKQVNDTKKEEESSDSPLSEIIQIFTKYIESQLKSCIFF